MTIAPGCVIEVMATHITPPHRKYYVICDLDPPPLGFFINSQINQFIAKRPRLKSGQVLLTKAEHAFLTYDSWLDCTDVHTFTREFLEREVRTNPPALLGRISAEALSRLIAAVKVSHTLPRNQIERICGAFKRADDQAAGANDSISGASVPAEPAASAKGPRHV